MLLTNSKYGLFYTNCNKLDTKDCNHRLNIQDSFCLLYSLLYQLSKLHQSTVVSFLLLPYLETITEYHSSDGQKNYYNFQSQKLFVDSLLLYAFCAIFILCYRISSLPIQKGIMSSLYFFPNHPANPECIIFNLFSFFEAEPVAGELRKGTSVWVCH